MLHIEINRIHSDVFVQDGANGFEELSIQTVRSAFPYFIPKTNNIWTYRSTLDEMKYDKLCKHIACSLVKTYSLHEIIYEPHKTFGKLQNELPVSDILPYLKVGLAYANEHEADLKTEYVHGSTQDYTKFIKWLELFISYCEVEQEESYISVEHIENIVGNLP